MDDLTYLRVLPAEIWMYIFHCFLRKRSEDPLGAPYPLVETERVTSDRETAQTLALTCKLFYDIVAPLLADRVEVDDLTYFQTPGRLRRSTFNAKTSPYIPSTIVVDLYHEVKVCDLVSKHPHPSLRQVSHLHLAKPWWNSDTFMHLIDFLATRVGPQVHTVFVLPNDGGWLVDDVSVLSNSLPGLRRLHIADLCFFNEDVNADDHGDTNLPPADPFPVPTASFPSLEWLGLGQLAFTHRCLNFDDERGFMLLLEGITISSCPNLERLDVLQYVGPLIPVLERYNTVLRCLCLAASVVEIYYPSIPAIPSLSTLRVVVDCMPAFCCFSHPSISLISVYVPAAVLSTPESATPLTLHKLILRLFEPLFLSTLPSLRTVCLSSEVPVAHEYLQNFRRAFSASSIDFQYAEVF